MFRHAADKQQNESRKTQQITKIATYCSVNVES